MHNVVLNIPHAGIAVPEWAMKEITVSKEELAALVHFMVDKDVDRLWSFVPEQSKQVAALSRIVVDTERYRNDAEEPMASKGMGLYYTHTPDGKPFRLKSEDAYAKCLDIYDAYHSALERKVSVCLEKHGTCILLDCHSFHDGMRYTGFDPDSFPDVCIGVNEEMTPVAKRIVDTFLANGYTVKVNEPFSGSLVPMRFLNDRRVSPVMVELNRRIYDNASFHAVQNICKEIYHTFWESLT